MIFSGLFNLHAERTSTREASTCISMQKLETPVSSQSGVITCLPMTSPFAISFLHLVAKGVATLRCRCESPVRVSRPSVDLVVASSLSLARDRGNLASVLQSRSCTACRCISPSLGQLPRERSHHCASVVLEFNPLSLSSPLQRRPALIEAC